VLTNEPAEARRLGAEVNNQFSGTAAGSVVQVGTVTGGFHIHDAGPPQVTPHQLPGRAPNFVNRVHELDAMTRLLTQTSSDARTGVISAIYGTAGIGKTALAVQWAHSVHEQFPDGQLYVNLRGFDPTGMPLAPGDALALLLEGLGVPPDRVPVSADGRAALYRSLLNGRRILVVLDNVAETAQVEPLLPGGAPCAALVTSRNRLDGLTVRYGARRVQLGLLAATESQELMARHVGADRLASEPDACSELIRRCGHLPLALAIVAARAAFYPDFPLQLLAEELRDQRSPLDALDTGDLTTNIRAVFSWSYRQLPSTTARVFRLLGLHSGPDIGLPAAAALAAMSLQNTRRHLAVIARAHLLEQHMPHRFRLHDLLRTYAAERAAEDEPGPEQQLALRRVLDSYLHTAHNASRELNVHRPRIPLDPPQSGIVIRQFDTRVEAMRWYQEEYLNLMAIIEWTASHAFDNYSWRQALTFWQYLYLCGRWHEIISTHEIALSAAERTGNHAAVAAVHTNLGVGHGQLGDYELAMAHFQRALELYRDIGELYGQGNALDSLAWVYTQTGDFPAAIARCEEALAIYRRTGHRDGQARTLDSLGVAHAGLGQYEQAISYGQQATGLHQEADDRIGQAHALRNLGRCYAQTGQHDDAVTCFQEALAHCRDIGDRFDEACTLRDLGSALQAVGQNNEARGNWDQALAILAELHHPAAAAVQEDLATLPPRQ
jgi:tetratricopeptide (TPR) repeat protein